MHELRVLTGLHRGAALPLTGSQWWIGAAQDADLALYDPGIKDRHCQLNRSEQGWELSALQGLLQDNEGQRCQQLSGLQPGTPFAIGHIWLSIVDAATPWPEECDKPAPDAESVSLAQTPASPAEDAPLTEEKRRLPLWAKALYLLLSLLLLLMLGSWQLHDSLASPSAPPLPTKPSLASVESTRQILARMLSDRALDKQVSVAGDGNSLILSGNLSSEDSQRLQRMLHTLYRHYDVRLAIHNRISTLSPHLPFRIVQISSGPHANIVTDGGQRLFIGDEVDRLRLVAINSDSIEFAGRASIRVKW